MVVYYYQKVTNSKHKERGNKMELIKMKDRNLRADDMLKAFRSMGSKTKSVGEYCKWKELRMGSRLQVKIEVFEVKNDNFCAYMVVDSFRRVAAQLQPDKKEVLGWLKEHGYKPVKQWYLEDYGMTEETWNEWNGMEG